MDNRLMTLNKTDILIALLLFALALSFYLNYATEVIWSPDELNYYMGANELIHHGSINLNNPLNEEYESNIFNYGFTIFKNSTEQYPGGFTGSLLFYALIMRVFSTSAFFFVAPVFGAIGVVAICFIVKTIFGSRYLGILAALLLFSTPIWIRWSTEHYNNVPMTTFFLLALLALLALKGNARFLVAGVLLSIAIIIRLPAALLLPPFLLLLVMQQTGRRQYLLFLAPIAFALLVFLPVAKYALYGDPFFLPFNHVHSYPVGLLAEDTSTSVSQHFAFSSGDRAAIVDATRFFFTKSFPFLFLYPSLVGLLLLFKDRKRYFSLIAAVLVILLVFHGRAYGGFEAGGRESLQSSFLRYMIPVYALLPIGFAYLFKEIAGKITHLKYVAVLLGTIMILMISFTVTYSDYGLDMLEDYRNDRIAIGHKIDSVIEPKSIIITDLVANHDSAINHENIIY